MFCGVFQCGFFFFKIYFFVLKLYWFSTSPFWYHLELFTVYHNVNALCNDVFEHPSVFYTSFLLAFLFFVLKRKSVSLNSGSDCLLLISLIINKGAFCASACAHPAVGASPWLPEEGGGAASGQSVSQSNLQSQFGKKIKQLRLAKFPPHGAELVSSSPALGEAMAARRDGLPVRGRRLQPPLGEAVQFLDAPRPQGSQPAGEGWRFWFCI